MHFPVKLAATLLLLCGSSFAATVYVSQSAGSVSCGTDGAQSTTAVASVTWAAGNTYKLCGTITSSVTVGASGTSGSPITLYFESGSSITEAVCPSTGCLNISGLSYIIVDGGGGSCGWVSQINTACSQGSIQATASGSAFGNGATSSFGIEATNCAYCEIKGLLISNIYQHTSSTDSPSGDMRCIDQLGITTATATFLVHNNTVHDCSSALVYVPGTTNDNGYQSFNNEIYNVNSCHDLSNNNNGDITAALFHDNHCHDTSNWDTTSPLCAAHHNFMHSFAYTLSNSNVSIYDNLIDGNWGNCPTSELFFEGNSSTNNNCIVYNNRFLASYQQENNGIISMTCGGTTYFVNNTVIGNYQSGDGCLNLGTNTSSHWTIKDNIISGCHTILQSNDSVATFTGNMTGGMDYNTWGGTSSNPWALNCSGGCTYYATLTAWQATGFDTHSNWTNNNTYVAVNGNGTLQSSSPARGVGENLAGLFTGINTDALGVGRPSSSAWDDGCCQYSVSSVSAPAPCPRCMAERKTNSVSPRVNRRSKPVLAETKAALHPALKRSWVSTAIAPTLPTQLASENSSTSAPSMSNFRKSIESRQYRCMSPKMLIPCVAPAADSATVAPHSLNAPPVAVFNWQDRFHSAARIGVTIGYGSHRLPNSE